MPRCLTSDFSRALLMDSSGRYSPFCCGSRKATIIAKKGALTFTLGMGGVYETRILNTSGQVVEQVDKSETGSLQILWMKATFIGWHWLLGQIKVDLVPDTKNEGTIAPQKSSQMTTLPAVNSNEFHFNLEIPRFRKTYRNKVALVNSATISEVPPINAIYELNNPVRFENPNENDDWVDITKCWVHIPDQKYIEIDVTSIERYVDRFDVEATLENKSPFWFTIAYWFTHTDEPNVVSYEPAMGMIFLTRRKRKIKLTMRFTEMPTDPVIQIGAALITNPITNDPDQPTGNAIVAFNVNRRIQHLA